MRLGSTLMYFLDKVIGSSVEGVNNAVHVLYSLRFLNFCSLKIAYILHLKIVLVTYRAGTLIS